MIDYGHCPELEFYLELAVVWLWKTDTLTRIATTSGQSLTNRNETLTCVGG